MNDARAPWVGVIMGSRSDLETMEPAIALLTELDVPHEVRIVSAHRTPDLMFEYAAAAEGRGLLVIIAAAGGAAHLPGMTAAKTLLPVLGVPTGTPFGIWAIERKASTPLRAVAATGTPSTGSSVFAAVMPGR